MVYRFFVALAFNVVVFPYVAMYTFSLSYPTAHFAFDQPTWLQGLMVIAFGWALFLLPGLLPFVGHRYYDWVARKTGCVALVDGIRSGLSNIRSSLVRAKRSIAGVVAQARSADRRSLKELFKRDKKPEIPTLEAPKVEKEMSKPTKTALLATEGLNKAKVALRDAPKTFSDLKSTFSTLRERLTPDELQKAINLNQYTLETFFHIKAILKDMLAAADVSPTDRTFIENVLSAIPEPPSPSETTRPLIDWVFDYPEEQRPALKNRAAQKKIALRDTDFELARRGDLERALLIVKSMVLNNPLNSNGKRVDVEDDVMLGFGLPMGSTS